MAINGPTENCDRLKESLEIAAKKINFLATTSSPSNNFIIKLDNKLKSLFLGCGYFAENEEALHSIKRGFDVEELNICILTGSVELNLKSYYPPSGKVLEEKTFKEDSNTSQLKYFLHPHLDELCEQQAERIWEIRMQEEKRNQIENILNTFLNSDQ